MSDGWYQRRGGEVLGRIWECGDSVCDCTQAIIVKVIAPTHTGEPGSYGWHEEPLWQGTYVSSDSDVGERAEQASELAAAAEKFGLVRLSPDVEFYVEPARSGTEEGGQAGV